MPVVRTSNSITSNNAKSSRFFAPLVQLSQDLDKTAKNITEIVEESSSESAEIEFPTTEKARKQFVNKAGKRITSHQWAVYDFTLTIPFGKVTTYKDVSLAAGGSPRSVGSALRNNPFAPYVPCHRVIASDLFVGGFYGEWGPNDKTGTRFNQKLRLLQDEGVLFSEKGHLLGASKYLWRDRSLPE